MALVPAKLAERQNCGLKSSDTAESARRETIKLQICLWSYRVGREVDLEKSFRVGEA